MTALTGLARALDLALQDLAAINARLETVHTEAWLPAKPDHDKPTPDRDVDPDPDKVPGDKWDAGIASYAARVAWERMAEHLDDAEAVSVAAWDLFVGHDTIHAAPLRPSSLLDVQLGVRRLAKRLRAFQGAYTALYPNEPRARWLADNLMGPRGRPYKSPCWRIEAARYEILSIVAIVGTGQKPPICSECRRVGSIGQPRKGGKCDACYQRKWRLEARQRRTAVRNHRAAP